MLPRLALVCSLLLQFYGIVFVYALLLKRNNDLMLAYFMAKTTIARRRERYNRLRKLCRRKRSKWVKNGRTDAWWINMIRGITTADEWKRNFRMTREEFQNLCEELRPYISARQTPNCHALSVEKKVCKHSLTSNPIVGNGKKIRTGFTYMYAKPFKLNTVIIFIARNCNPDARYQRSAVINTNDEYIKIQLFKNSDMAERATRHAKPVIAYSSLHNLCDVIRAEKRRKHGKKTIGKFYKAERIIERRNGPNTVLILSDLS